MWPPTVEVGAVFSQDDTQMSFAEDQLAVGEFGLAVSNNLSAKKFALRQRERMNLCVFCHSGLATARLSIFHYLQY
jgi:hypothetical protein